MSTILNDRTHFQLNIPLIIECLTLVLSISQKILSVNKKNIHKKIKKTDFYLSDLKSSLTKEKIEFISLFLKFDFSRCYESENTFEHQVADWFILQGFDLTTFEKIDYATETAPDYLTKNQKELWLNYPFHRQETGLYGFI